MRAQLLPMEPCTDAFIAGCDVNDDDLISIIEWGKCMGLTEGKDCEVQVQDFCFMIKDNLFVCFSFNKQVND